GGVDADRLDGGTGNDAMTGGKGDDTYVVDATGDKVNETLTFANGGGIDTVESGITFTLAALANIDNLTLTGSVNTNATGNALANTMTGNTFSNLLDGGKGIDTYIGNK